MEAADSFLTITSNAILRWLLCFSSFPICSAIFLYIKICIYEINKEVSVENKSLLREGKMTLNWQLYRRYDAFD